jgi:hypothetical protein
MLIKNAFVKGTLFKSTTGEYTVKYLVVAGGGVVTQAHNEAQAAMSPLLAAIPYTHLLRRVLIPHKE